FVRITSLQEAGTPDARASVKIRAQSVRLGASLCRLRQSEPRRGYLFAWIEGPPPGRAKSHTRGSPNPGIFWNQNRLLGNARRRSDRKILLVKHSRREASTIQSDNLKEMSGGLGELLFQVGVGCAKAVNVSSRLRCLRTKTGNASSAFRPFASQGHLVGTVIGPACGRPSQGSSLS